MDDAKEFCLKWNSFMDVFQGTFAKLLNKEHFVDVSLACDGETIKCHKVVLSACSNYFQSLLLENQHPHPLIILRDVPAKDMQALIRFMYTGEVTVAQTQLNSLIRVADLLKIKGLADTESKSEKKEPQVETPQPPTPPVRGENAFSSQYSDTRTPPLKRKRTKPPPPPLVERTAVPASVPLSLTLPHEVPQGSPGLPEPESQSQQSHNSSEPALSPRDNAVTPNMEEGNQSFKELKSKQDVSVVEDDGEENSNQFDDGGDEFDFKHDGSVIGNGDEAGSSNALNPSALLKELLQLEADGTVSLSQFKQLRPARGYSYTEAHLFAALRLVKDGMTYREASDFSGVPLPTLKKYLKRYGLQRNQQRERVTRPLEVDNHSIITESTGVEQQRPLDSDNHSSVREPTAYNQPCNL